MTDEEFNNWNELKKKVDLKNKKMFYEEGFIYWVILGKNVGVEQDGKNENFSRPVLILERFNKDMFLGIPVSSKIKKDKFHYNFKNGRKENSVILSQIRLLSSKRIFTIKEKLKEEDFENIKKQLRDVIFK